MCSRLSFADTYETFYSEFLLKTSFIDLLDGSKDDNLFPRLLFEVFYTPLFDLIEHEEYSSSSSEMLILYPLKFAKVEIIFLWGVPVPFNSSNALIEFKLAQFTSFIEDLMLSICYIPKLADYCPFEPFDSVTDYCCELPSFIL